MHEVFQFSFLVKNNFCISVHGDNIRIFFNSGVGVSLVSIALFPRPLDSQDVLKGHTVAEI